MLQGAYESWVLNTNVRFRPNDAYKAAFMNMFALTRLQNNIAELSGMKIKLGRYVHQADSYHIYGSYFKEFEERAYRYADVKFIMDEAIPAIREKATNMGK